MERSEVAHLSALARRKETRRFVRCELAGMDDREIRTRLVEEYERSMELEACEAQVSALEGIIASKEREISRAEDRAIEAEGRVEDARESMTAVIQALNELPEEFSDLAEEIRKLAWDPQDMIRRKRIQRMAEEMRKK